MGLCFSIKKVEPEPDTILKYIQTQNKKKTQETRITETRVKHSVQFD